MNRLAAVDIIYVTVCKNTILSNLKRGENKPPIRISVGKHGKCRRSHSFEIEGRIKVVYSPHRPLPWGARVWLEIIPSKQLVARPLCFCESRPKAGSKKDRARAAASVRRRLAMTTIDPSKATPRPWRVEQTSATPWHGFRIVGEEAGSAS